MAQKIKQGSIFGRIGTGIGKGLAAQLPEEIQRGRLASGLKNFEQEHQDLNPMQQLARISSIPGVTPQMIQSFSELARINNQRNAYGNIGQGQGYPPGQPGQQGQQGVQASPDLTQVKEANLLDQAVNAGTPMQQQFNPQANPMPQGGIGAATAGFVPNGQRTPNAVSNQTTPEIVNEPPLADRTLTKAPWSPQERDARVVQYMDQGFLVDQAKELAADDEQRDLSSPAAYQKRLDELTAKSDQARQEFRRQLETKLQKVGEGVFKDVTGEMLVNMERGLERDLRTNPNASFKDVANDWSNRALNVAKAKDQLNKLAQTTGIETFFKGDQTLKKLRSYQEIFNKSGNSEEYYNILRKSPDQGGFGLSPQGSAVIAFPPTKQVKGYVDTFKPNNTKWSQYGPLPDPAKINSNARKAAIDVEKLIDADDSILSIVRALTEKDPDFNQEAFFEQLNEDQDRIRLNDRQRRELAEGQRDILPTWGDIKYLPWFRRSTK